MRELFQKIISEYRIAKEQQFAGNPLAGFIRKELKTALKIMVDDDKRYLVHSSPGQGVWTGTPWLAVFDILVTTTAQKGFYPVFIFRDDMSGIYLTLNQGVTDIRKDHKSNARNLLKINALEFRASIGTIPANFKETDIHLHMLKNIKGELAKDYEAGNIIAKFYQADNLPSDTIFTKDISEMLAIYKKAVFSDDKITVEDDQEDTDSKGYERKQYRQHKRIERNQILIKKVKKAQGFICKACTLDFVEKYGDLGKNFIEAHHLKPISQLTEDIVELDARKDFVVLCANCHRMIHRTHDVSNLEAFKLHIQLGNETMI